jgi:hypothetical protein
MRMTELDERLVSSNLLYEGLDNGTIVEAMLWEDLGRSLIEAKLTPDQIQDLFGQVQADATATGANRTKIGKAADIATKSGKKTAEYTRKAMAAFEDLKSAIANTDEMTAFDAKYDRVAEKLKQSVGGDDSKIMKAIYAYRDQAKKHPILQGAAYAVAIGALGLSGAGLPGAAVLGLIKLGDRLLQGDKATAAVWQGLKTAGITAAIGAAKEYFKGASVPTPQSGAADAAANYNPFSRTNIRKAVNAMQELAKDGTITDYNSYQAALKDISKEMAKAGDLGLTEMQILEKKISLQIQGQVASAEDGTFRGGMPKMIKRFIELNGGSPGEGIESDIKASAARTLRDVGNFEENARNGDRAILEAFNLIEISLAGLAKQGLGKAAGAIGAGAKSVAGKVADIGSGYTNVISARALAKAWRNAGSPDDSKKIYDLLIAQGVPDAVIKSAFKNKKVPIPKKPKAAKQPPTPEPESPVVKTSNDDLNSKVNEIIKTQGKEAAIKFLQDLKQKNVTAQPATAGQTSMTASDGNTYQLSIGKAGDRIWLNSKTGAEASSDIDKELERSSTQTESIDTDISRLIELSRGRK